MKIDRKLVLHVADLARLELSDSEVTLYQTQLERILEYVKVLDIDAGASPTSFAPAHHDGVGVERSDVVVPPLVVEVALGSAPECHDMAFQVPKIIE